MSCCSAVRLRHSVALRKRGLTPRTVDQPLETAKDSSGKLYLKCDYNRDGDSYRSPWTNEFDPALDDGFKPSARLRAIEENANIIWDTYRAMYYECVFLSRSSLLAPRSSCY